MFAGKRRYLYFYPEDSAVAALRCLQALVIHRHCRPGGSNALELSAVLIFLK